MAKRKSKSESNSPQHSHYIAIVAIVADVAVVILVMSSMKTSTPVEDMAMEEVMEAGEDQALAGKGSWWSNFMKKPQIGKMSKSNIVGIDKTKKPVKGSTPKVQEGTICQCRVPIIGYVNDYPWYNEGRFIICGERAFRDTGRTLMNGNPDMAEYVCTKSGLKFVR